VAQPVRGLSLLVLSALVASAAQAGEPVALAERSGIAEARARTTLRWLEGERDGISERGAFGLRFGPQGFCTRDVDPGEFALSLWAGSKWIRLDGSLEPMGRRVAPVPDPVVLEERLAEWVAARCEEVHGAAFCAERLATLEPRLGRTKLSFAARARHGQVQARLGGRFELLLVDPASEETVLRASLVFRQQGPLALVPAPSISGVCITVFNFAPPPEGE
jgi:hypothetical protein